MSDFKPIPIGGYLELELPPFHTPSVLQKRYSSAEMQKIVDIIRNEIEAHG